ncbi:hypothetical protein [Algoriphagus mannitolivorans]|uniref:hypothetical protein n=1 Tax=Algoriphagus mannitolivorans TaxID=226504 RepID=UPI0004172643|nr:hypothetical protein [Algoriphagus mannitolivorans]
MKLAEKLWHYVSLLSLDVALGAMAGLLFFSQLLRVDIGWQIFLLLGLAVWSIYTGDHLWDANQAKVLVSHRHSFHAKNKKTLSGILLLVVLLGMTLAFRILGLGKEFYLSVILGGVILLTMILLRKAGRASGYLKEFSTSVFYVLGIAWIPMLRANPEDLILKPLLFFLFFIALAFLNLLMLAELDRKDDRAQGFASVAAMMDPGKLILGIRRLNFLLIFLGLAGFILLNSFYRPFTCVLMLIALIHFLSFFRTNLSAEAKRKRMEASFLLPWLLLVL